VLLVLGALLSLQAQVVTPMARAWAG